MGTFLAVGGNRGIIVSGRKMKLQIRLELGGAERTFPMSIIIDDVVETIAGGVLDAVQDVLEDALP